MSENETIILGIDPGTSIFGYGVIRIRNKQIELIALGSVNLSKYSNHQLKIKYIFERVQHIVDNIRLIYVQLKHLFLERMFSLC